MNTETTGKMLTKILKTQKHVKVSWKHFKIPGDKVAVFDLSGISDASSLASGVNVFTSQFRFYWRLSDLLQSKCMSNIYLKMTFPKLQFLKLKKSASRSFLATSALADVKEFAATYDSEVTEQRRMLLFHYFNFERNYKVLKSKSPYFLLSN